MLEGLLILVVLMLIAIAVLLCVLLYLVLRMDLLPVLDACRDVRSHMATADAVHAADTTVLDAIRADIAATTAVRERLDRLESATNAIPANAAAFMQRAIDPYRIELHSFRKEMDQQAQQLREELLKMTTESAKRTREEVSTNMGTFTSSQRQQLDGVLQQLHSLMDSNDKRLGEIRSTLEGRLRNLQEDNAKNLTEMRQTVKENLTEMRQTVDEKLQGTLERRLGESFQQVVEQLRAVDRGVGEMQTLVASVGDLRRILSNVKSRGMWGETQLARMLEDIFTRDQYVTNVSTKFANERVEFAIRLPGTGKDADEIVLLPIDSKFPTEDYQRLIEAQEKGDSREAEEHAKKLENRITACAEDISKKYRNPPKTTDFAIMFLPTEGLFAEVLRRPGLAARIQKNLKVVIAGPSTLWAILMGLQMGFATLRIERRSSEVLSTLQKVKQEFGEFSKFLRMIDDKLRDTSSKVKLAIRKTDGIETVLRHAGKSPVEFSQGNLFVEPHIELPIDDNQGLQKLQPPPSHSPSAGSAQTIDGPAKRGDSLFT